MGHHDWTAIIPNLVSGKLRCHHGACRSRPERDEVMRFSSDPYKPQPDPKRIRVDDRSVLIVASAVVSPSPAQFRPAMSSPECPARPCWNSHPRRVPVAAVAQRAKLTLFCRQRPPCWPIAEADGDLNMWAKTSDGGRHWPCPGRESDVRVNKQSSDVCDPVRMKADGTLNHADHRTCCRALQRSKMQAACAPVLGAALLIILPKITHDTKSRIGAHL